MRIVELPSNQYDIKWGVVNSGNALCAAIFETRKEARKWRKENAYAYAVKRVKIIPEDSWGV